MRKLIGRVTALILPAKSAKAAPTRGRCGSGCGSDGAWYASQSMPGDRIPCC